MFICNSMFVERISKTLHLSVKQTTQKLDQARENFQETDRKFNRT